MRNVARVGCLAGVASLLFAAAWLWLEVPAPAAPAVHATALSLASTVALHRRGMKPRLALTFERWPRTRSPGELKPGRTPRQQ